MNKNNRIRITNLLFGISGFVLLLISSQTIKAQFDSYAKMMNMTRTWNQNLWDEQRRLQQLTDRMKPTNSITNPSSTTSNPQPARLISQYPLTTTDFSPSPNRLAVDEFANGVPNLTPVQRDATRQLYYRFLDAYEKEARKNNVASSFAFITGISFVVVSGKQLGVKDAEMLITYFNNNLGNTPQFKNLSAQQKQTLYEALIITGGLIGFYYNVGVQQKDPVLQLQAIDLAKSVLRNFIGMNVP